jgi:acyl-CoA thioester hydrolase
MQFFSMPLRVYLEDTDAGGIVFYANYLKHMERARTEWLRACGVELDLWQQRDRRLFVVRSANMDFLRPAKFNDELVVSAKLLTQKPASLVCEQTIMRATELLVTATVRLACVNADTLAPTAIPSEIREAIGS